MDQFVLGQNHKTQFQALWFMRCRGLSLGYERIRNRSDSKFEISNKQVNLFPLCRLVQLSINNFSIVLQNVTNCKNYLSPPSNKSSKKVSSKNNSNSVQFYGNSRQFIFEAQTNFRKRFQNVFHGATRETFHQ